MPSPLPPLKGIQAYDGALYLTFGDRTLAWEFNGWEPESLSWKYGCYIHAGLSGWQLDFNGPEALIFLSSLCTNSFAKFPIGSMKHAVMCTEAGLIASHAILQRNGEESFRLFASGLPWAQYQASQTKYRVAMEPFAGYLHQVAGPNSLATLERATGEGLRDIDFLRFRRAIIDGKTVDIGRIGMAGTLAYEVRGPLDEGPGVYESIVRAGQEFGIERLGWRAYFVNHVEGGFPQAGWTFYSAAIDDPAFRAFSERGTSPRWTGSVSPANRRARYRTPCEVGWQRAVRFDHDFIGREALKQEDASPRRRIVTLRWNPDDVADIFTSLLRPGEVYKTIDLPTTPSWFRGVFAHADTILKDGREVGYSSGTVYSYHFREVLSHGTLDVESSDVGAEVLIKWGDYGGRIKDVRATVSRYPYLSEGRNDNIDATKL